MPIPLLLGIAAGIAAVVGAGAAIHGASKMSEANDTIEAANSKQRNALSKLKRHQKSSFKVMDDVGKQELLILKSFEKFSDTIEKIQGRPKFHDFQKDGIKIPKYEPASLKDVSVGAGILLGAAGGAAVGTLGGFAAAGATTAAVAALGTASTGTAIASLSGVAATNATLAALGGGAIAAGALKERVAGKVGKFMNGKSSIPFLSKADLSAVKLILEVVSGTLLMQTNIFICCS